jgi:integrase
MQPKRSARPPAGTGSLIERSDRAGRRTWYAKFRVGERQVKRRLGRVREPGASTGLTRRQAEAELRRAIEREAGAAGGVERIDLATAADRYIDHVEHVRGRKATTVADYRANVRRHLAPFFAGRSLEAIDPQLVESYLAAKLREGLTRKTIQNHLTLLHGIFAHAVRRGWVLRNPVAAADLPSQGGPEPDIRCLDREELEALIRAVPDDALGAMERVIYLTAAMSGLRQGELIALRWCDVDWVAGVVRVRRSYTRGEYTVPKSRRSSRAVPLADRLAGELERHSAAPPTRATRIRSSPTRNRRPV